MSLRSVPVCVYCGSRYGINDNFGNNATHLGTALAEAGCQLVYGAGDIGLMGRVARAAQKAGGDTMGVIPEHLLNLEIGKRDLSRFVVTQTMHERKKVMFMNAAAIVVLPGGAGTLDEFFEVLTWFQLGLHEKPIILLNTDGYWSPLVGLVDHVIGQGFADPSLRSAFFVADSVEATMEFIRQKLGVAEA